MSTRLVIAPIPRSPRSATASSPSSASRTSSDTNPLNRKASSVTTPHRLWRTLVALLALPLLAAACGGGDSAPRSEAAPATRPIGNKTAVDLSGVTLRVGDQ